MMKTWEAMQLVDEGKKVRVKGWAKGCYIYKNENGDWLTDSGDACCDFIKINPFDEWEIYED